MELDWLRDFAALAEHGNFSRAAEARNVTQPAFSRRIRALEEWVGAALFTRSAQGAALNEAGRTFRPLAEDLLRRLERARHEAASAGDRQASSLAIAATHALSFTFFPGWIRRHVSLDALGALNLVSDSMRACEQILLNGGVHFLLCHHHSAAAPRFEPERFPSIVVGTDKLVPLSAPAADGRPIWPIPGTARKPTRLLGYSSASGLGRILAAEVAQPAMPPRIDTVFTSHLAATLVTMARNGEGAAWLPMTLVEDDLAERRLVDAAAGRQQIPIEIRLFRSTENRNAAADALWAALGPSA